MPKDSLISAEKSLLREKISLNVLFYLFFIMVYTTMLTGCGGKINPNIGTIDPPNNLIASRTSTSSILTWETSSDKEIIGYLIYRGQTNESRSFSSIGNTIYLNNTFTDPGLISTVGYYYAVTAIKLNGDESIFSNVASVEPYSVNLPITISSKENRQ